MTSHRTPVAVDESEVAALIQLTGDIDAATAGQVRAVLASTAGRAAVVDLTGVTFIDSAGLGVIIGAARRSREAGGMVALRCRAGSVRRLLTSVGMERLVPIHEDVASAVHAVASAATANVSAAS